MKESHNKGDNVEFLPNSAISPFFCRKVILRCNNSQLGKKSDVGRVIPFRNKLLPVDVTR